jgi:hypothetical protein
MDIVMKRRLCMTIALFFLMIGISSASAFSSTSKGHDVNAFTFVELSTKRMLEAEQATRLKLLRVFDHYPNFIGTPPGQIRANTASGAIYFDAKDHNIIEFNSTLMNLSQDDDHNLKTVYKVIVAMSALEYGAVDEEIMRITEKMTPFQKMENIFLNEIQIRLNSHKFLDELIDGANMVVYSGNFTYSLDYCEIEDPETKENIEMILLTAVK